MSSSLITFLHFLQGRQLFLAYTSAKPAWTCAHTDRLLHPFHSHTLTPEPLLFPLSLLHRAPLPPISPAKSFHIHTLSLLCSAGTLWCILPCLSPRYLLFLLSLPLSTSLYWRLRSATACRGHCGRRSQNDSRHSSLPPFFPRPIIHPFLRATLSLPPLCPYTRSVP